MREDDAPDDEADPTCYLLYCLLFTGKCCQNGTFSEVEILVHDPQRLEAAPENTVLAALPCK